MLKKKYFSLFFVLTFIVSYALASCSECCSMGRCNTAFRGAAGVCCSITEHNGYTVPSCCPEGSMCARDETGRTKCAVINPDVMGITTSYRGPEGTVSTGSNGIIATNTTMERPRRSPLDFPELHRNFRSSVRNQTTIISRTRDGVTETTTTTSSTVARDGETPVTTSLTSHTTSGKPLVLHGVNTRDDKTEANVISADADDTIPRVSTTGRRFQAMSAATINYIPYSSIIANDTPNPTISRRSPLASLYVRNSPNVEGNASIAAPVITAVAPATTGSTISDPRSRVATATTPATIASPTMVRPTPPTAPTPPTLTSSSPIHPATYATTTGTRRSLASIVNPGTIATPRTTPESVYVSATITPAGRTSETTSEGVTSYVLTPPISGRTNVYPSSGSTTASAARTLVSSPVVETASSNTMVPTTNIRSSSVIRTIPVITSTSVNTQPVISSTVTDTPAGSSSSFRREEYETIRRSTEFGEVEEVEDVADAAPAPDSTYTTITTTSAPPPVAPIQVTPAASSIVWWPALLGLIPLAILLGLLPFLCLRRSRQDKQIVIEQSPCPPAPVQPVVKKSISQIPMPIPFPMPQPQMSSIELNHHRGRHQYHNHHHHNHHNRSHSFTSPYSSRDDTEEIVTTKNTTRNSVINAPEVLSAMRVEVPIDYPPQRRVVHKHLRHHEIVEPTNISYDDPGVSDIIVGSEGINLATNVGKDGETGTARYEHLEGSNLDKDISITVKPQTKNISVANNSQNLKSSFDSSSSHSLNHNKYRRNI